MYKFIIFPSRPAIYRSIPRVAGPGHQGRAGAHPGVPVAQHRRVIFHFCVHRARDRQSHGANHQTGRAQWYQRTTQEAGRFRRADHVSFRLLVRLQLTRVGLTTTDRPTSSGFHRDNINIIYMSNILLEYTVIMF